ncbi:MAG: C39 family peptidase [Lachnospira sp.]
MKKSGSGIITLIVFIGILIFGFTLNAIFLKTGIISKDVTASNVLGNGDKEDSDTGNNGSEGGESNNEELPDYALISVDNILQNPELPTGCEITSLTIVLRYYGYDVTKEEMADIYLTKGNGNFWEMFHGNPRDNSGRGCYARPIAEAANKYFEANGISRKAEDISGSDFNDILRLVSKGMPVVIWNTMDMKEPQIKETFTFEGEEYAWKSPEHCVVIKGYNLTEDVVYIADPARGDVTRNLTLFKQRYEDIYSQAVYIPK